MPVISIRMSASSSTMRTSLAMPCRSFHCRYRERLLAPSAAAVRRLVAQREHQAHDGAAAFAVAQDKIAAVILHDLLHNCEAKSSTPLPRRNVGLGQAAAVRFGQALAVVGDID